MAMILVVGAADTGRAPMAAALLRMLLEEHGIEAEVGSAGVIGHDGDEIQEQARLALQHLVNEQPEHYARSLTPPLAQEATLLLAIDRGTARVIIVRHLELADRLLILSKLAGTNDIPDPFHMSLDAWVIYGRALQEQLQRALPEILSRLRAADSVPALAVEVVSPDEEREQQEAAQAGQQQPATRLTDLLLAMRSVPEIIDWQKAKEALNQELSLRASRAQPGDLAPAVAALLQGLLGQQAGALSPGQVCWLAEAGQSLEQHVDATQMARIAAEAAQWPTL